ncbi:hypothetical protein B0X31_01775 [Helicobacter pylori]|nr:hypothetical protein B0X31_01775 [Helicobacter pylori]
MGLLSFVHVHGGIQFFKNAFKGYRSTLELKLFAIKYSIKSSCQNGLYFAPLINLSICFSNSMICVIVPSKISKF